jgi:ribosome-associated protein
MNTEILKKELSYRTSRSGGKGGQNVNKVETKVEVIFDPIASDAFSEEEKMRLLQRLAPQLTKDGLLQLTAQEERSQLANKEIVEQKLVQVLRNALKVEKVRKPSNVPKSVVAARRKNKAFNGIKKSTRKKVSFSKEDTDLF